MSRKGESITLSVDAADKAELERIALQFGCTWGDKPNISQLLKDIGRKKLKVVWSDDEDALTPVRAKQGKAAIEKIVAGLLELSAVLFKG